MWGHVPTCIYRATGQTIHSFQSSRKCSMCPWYTAGRKMSGINLQQQIYIRFVWGLVKMLAKHYPHQHWLMHYEEINAIGRSKKGWDSRDDQRSGEARTQRIYANEYGVRTLVRSDQRWCESVWGEKTWTLASSGFPNMPMTCAWRIKSSGVSG
jgi:hypothetical protein